VAIRAVRSTDGWFALDNIDSHLFVRGPAVLPLRAEDLCEKVYALIADECVSAGANLNFGALLATERTRDFSLYYFGELFLADQQIQGILHIAKRRSALFFSAWQRTKEQPSRHGNLEKILEIFSFDGVGHQIGYDPGEFVDTLCHVVAPRKFA
jgi:hypothetical protein